MKMNNDREEWNTWTCYTEESSRRYKIDSSIEKWYLKWRSWFLLLKNVTERARVSGYTVEGCQHVIYQTGTLK